MYSALIPLGLVLIAGMAWQALRPGGIAVATVRQALNLVVIYLFAPALIVHAVLPARIDVELLLIPLVGLLVGAVCLATALLVFVVLLRGRLSRPDAGSLVLACAFGNGLGMAVPATSSLFGLEAARVPLMYDLLATVPLVWIAGVMVAAWLGAGTERVRPGAALLRLPPFWALVVALGIRTSGVALPGAFEQALAMLANAAVPLLALLVGLSIRIPANIGLLALPLALACLIKLVLAPALALCLATPLDIGAGSVAPLVLTAAAPSVIVGVALAERFRLNSGLFSAGLTVTTLLYLGAAPLYIALAAG